MAGFHLTGFISLAAFAVLGCGSTTDANGNASHSGLTGTLFGQPFVARDTLLVHPQAWKSAAADSTAVLLTDTPHLCEQITSRVTTAPSRLVAISLEERDADGTVVALTTGEFVTTGQGDPSSRYGELFASAVDANCGFQKAFSDKSSIEVTSVGAGSAPLGLSVNVHFASGDSVSGNIGASATCDEAAVDAYLNDAQKCK